MNWKDKCKEMWGVPWQKTLSRMSKVNIRTVRRWNAEDSKINEGWIDKINKTYSIWTGKVESTLVPEDVFKKTYEVTAYTPEQILYSRKNEHQLAKRVLSLIFVRYFNFNKDDYNDYFDKDLNTGNFNQFNKVTINKFASYPKFIDLYNELEAYVKKEVQS